MKPQILDSAEWEAIARLIDAEFGDEISKTLLSSRTPIAIMDRDQKTIYLIPSAWTGTLLEEIQAGFDCHLAGEQLGVVKQGDFSMSLQVIPELTKLTTRVIVVSGKGAEAFTYGRSILKGSILSYDHTLKRGQKVLIVNEEKDCLGIASLAVDATRIEHLSQDSLVGKNIVDIGWFIRRLG